MPDVSGAFVGAHIVFGTFAIAAAAVAIGARKGATLHVVAGRIFAFAMIFSAALGAVLGLVRADEFYITFHAGVLSVTLISSGLQTARTSDFRSGKTGLAAGLVNFANLAGLIAAGTFALSRPDSVLSGFHAQDYFFLSGMAGIAMLGDINILLRKTRPERHRIARHLWRMCLGFFIAAGSAFTGPGAQAFPEAVRKSGILSAPELIILAMMLFWLATTLLGRAKPAHGRAA